MLLDLYMETCLERNMSIREICLLCRIAKSRIRTSNTCVKGTNLQRAEGGGGGTSVIFCSTLGSLFCIRGVSSLNLSRITSYRKGKSKVKCTLVHALRLFTGRTVHRWSRGIALPFHDHDTRRGWGGSVTPKPLFTLGKDPVLIVQEGVGPRDGLDRSGKFRPHRDSILGPSSP